MTFEKWWHSVQDEVGLNRPFDLRYLTRQSVALKAWDAAQAGMREPMACGHAKACEEKVGEGVYTIRCTVCAEMRELMKCGHLKACQMVLLPSGKWVSVRGNENGDVRCTVCEQLAQLKMVESCGHPIQCQIGDDCGHFTCKWCATLAAKDREIEILHNATELDQRLISGLERDNAALREALQFYRSLHPRCSVTPNTCWADRRCQRCKRADVLLAAPQPELKEAKS